MLKKQSMGFAYLFHCKNVIFSELTGAVELFIWTFHSHKPVLLKLSLNSIYRLTCFWVMRVWIKPVWNLWLWSNTAQKQESNNIENSVLSVFSSVRKMNKATTEKNPNNHQISWLCFTFLTLRNNRFNNKSKRVVTSDDKRSVDALWWGTEWWMFAVTAICLSVK